ncbi:hypothetical protein PR048_019356 [Dryococelus australis]|uniref:Uncharacterized protein n=1 Tax=Dryococelus australis TaxID=614101 RepID=A0ABQ9H3C1_9NEOP|nr:hypothetical protein PR048_019356 [Dryococelus australis]
MVVYFRFCICRLFKVHILPKTGVGFLLGLRLGPASQLFCADVEDTIDVVLDVWDSSHIYTDSGESGSMCEAWSFLATADSFATISFSYQQGETLVRRMVYQTCDAICQKLGPILLAPPDKKKNGKQLNNNFEAMMEVFSHSAFGKRFHAGRLDFPPDKPLPGTQQPLPHVLVDDEAFPLTRDLMRPYTGNELPHNYRHSRARNTSTCCLHNLLRDDSDATLSEIMENEEIARNSEHAMQDLRHIGGSFSYTAHKVRDTFKDFFNSPAESVDWQTRMVQQGHGVMFLETRKIYPNSPDNKRNLSKYNITAPTVRLLPLLDRPLQAGSTYFREFCPSRNFIHAAPYHSLPLVGGHLQKFPQMTCMLMPCDGTLLFNFK